ncbi:hypothetical protein [Gluconobacter sp. P5B12]|uniref:hypothetical protein n=1 Tax=unclassified Gluconobacter TaxID=2644261 RepID=UPI001C04285D|nr:hypothetical protein [Gluconobacter sp. P5B12]
MSDDIFQLSEEQMRSAMYNMALRSGWIVRDTQHCPLLRAPSDMSDIVAAKVDALIPECRLQGALEAFLQESGLHELLTIQSRHELQKSLMSLLLDRLQNLQAHDVRSELLQTWLIGPQTSNSSSVLADGDSGDSVAADPRNNGTPDTSEKGVNGDA